MDPNDREHVKSAQGASVWAKGDKSFDVPVVVDEAKCLTGCRVCVDSCPVDCLEIDPAKGKARMAHDECWYCLACEIDCPRDAIVVRIPYLVR
jgi:NAD-dependent dihydropyrimidine dehydrogenase PreA subunit